MTRQKIIIFEINETPLRIFRHFQKLRPGSNVDKLLEASQVIETQALDVDQSFLYPSQTWASLNTGAPYSSHHIHWYGDPKPDAYPLFWKTVAENGHSVGTVNTLHSSPAGSFAETNDNYKFVLPDCFAADSYTKPGYLEPFQQLNLSAVSANGRVATLKTPFKEAALTVMNAPRYGISMRTMWDGATLVGKILAKQVNKERARNLQFPLVGDIFMKLFNKHQPDLAIMFTNHVAANMHRYWYGLFPEDYPETLFDQQWIAKYRTEIIAAMDMFDDYLGKLMDLARQSNRILVIVSSMGQTANNKLKPAEKNEKSYAFRLDDVKKCADKLATNKYTYKIVQAMVPQYMIEFESLADATNYSSEVSAAIPSLKNLNVVCDLNERAVTLSIIPGKNGESISIRDSNLHYSDLGFSRMEVDDHQTGCHCPEGSLIVFNSKTAKMTKPSVNYLEYAPALLSHFGIKPLPYMSEPSFSF